METNFYHVTFKSRLDSIMSRGIKPIGVKHIYSEYTRKHPDSIYAFANLEDALKWWNHEEEAAKIDEEYRDEGIPVIIEFIDNILKYNNDEHWEMRKEYPSAMYKIPGEIVKPEQIKQVIEYNASNDKMMIDDDIVMTDAPE